jgi:class 3 adenylate cyclase
VRGQHHLRLGTGLKWAPHRIATALHHEFIEQWSHPSTSWHKNADTATIVGMGRRPDSEAEPSRDTLVPKIDTAGDVRPLVGDLDRVRLRFRNPDLESWFRAHFASHNITNLRIGYILGVALWIVWGAMVRTHLGGDRSLDLLIRYGVLIPLTTLGFALTFSRHFPRLWKWLVTTGLLITGLTWIGYVSEVRSMPADYGYVGLIFIQTFAFSILRLPFLMVVIFDLVTIPSYFVFALSSGELHGIRLLLAIFYLGSFSLLSLIASYVLEWKIRKLFVRERQLDVERNRSDALLLNILPQAIVERLKARRASGNSDRLAEAMDAVTVLFADAVGFTEQAHKTPPDDLVEALDGLFSNIDELADRYGLEKIKTVGDAYMAVAGVPTPRADHAEAAAEMALAILKVVQDARWPSGDRIVVRVGIASGPAVAGVIGQRKFAYDLWGDTVNLASRLESLSQPGRILASETVVAHLDGRYEFGPPLVLDLKGKGPTPARFLLHSFLSPMATSGVGTQEKNGSP